MPRILAFTRGPDDWKALLADPAKHWQKRFSARTLAHCWEDGAGFPPEIEKLFRSSADPLFADVSPLLAVPEFKVPLPGGDRSSQNDVFVLACAASRPITIMIEGKVDESFGPILGAWRKDASPGKQERLRYLLRMLGLAKAPADSVRYQLLHRAASAVIVGEQYRAAAAMLIVHTFTNKNSGWTDYAAFLDLFGIRATSGNLQRLPSASPVPLFAAWVAGDPKFLDY